jgi:hypothetical protein
MLRRMMWRNVPRIENHSPRIAFASFFFYKSERNQYIMASVNGGKRPGAGRPAGAKNKSTIAREASQKAAHLAVLAGLTDDEISKLMPLDVMLIAMRTEFTSGNFVIAAGLAEKAAAFCHGKKMADTSPTALPLDLMPDPPSIGDEPGPAGGVIE